MYFKRLRDAEAHCEKLNENDTGCIDEKWTPFPIYGVDEIR